MYTLRSTYSKTFRYSSTTTVVVIPPINENILVVVRLNIFPNMSTNKNARLNIYYIL